jgi:hypothetical protein
MDSVSCAALMRTYVSMTQPIPNRREVRGCAECRSRRGLGKVLCLPFCRHDREHQEVGQILLAHVVLLLLLFSALFVSQTLGSVLVRGLCVWGSLQTF